ncbi:MAG: hypothetical protein QOH08_1633 [Chloroflexota bacterium]|nr:hypothetical protein [Chloroflexota bacterium]
MSGAAAEAAWKDPAFVATAHAWLQDAAAAHAHPLTGPIEQVHIRPWSTVFRAPAAGSALFLKACSPVQAHEPRVIELVAREFPDLVPALIARHPREPWVLLGDGGERLRRQLPGAGQLAVWRALLPRYAELQRALLGRDAELLDLGLPDRRLHRIPELLERVLGDDRSAPPDVRGRVQALMPAIRRACATLAELGIGASLDHDDLHDHNVLLDGARPSIIDWGDASLTHPFLTLAVTLQFAAAAGGVPAGAAEIGALRDAYLEPWAAFGSLAALRRAARIGSALGAITGALTWYGIITRLDGVREDEPNEMASMLERIASAVGALEP